MAVFVYTVCERDVQAVLKPEMHILKGNGFRYYE